jgi:hypothetical protein
VEPVEPENFDRETVEINMNEQETANKEVKKMAEPAPHVTAKGHMLSYLDPLVQPQYHHFEGTTTIVCCLTLRNGFNVVGYSSTYGFDTKNFDRKTGEIIAFNMAHEKIWELLGFGLMQKIAESPVPDLSAGSR